MGEFVSIVCPVWNEERFIDRCIGSVLASEWPRGRMELLLVDGGSTDRTREIIGGYAAQHSFIRLLDNPRRVVPAAMNIGIEAARGDVIVRLDAHSAYPPDYIPRLVDALDELDADNIGGVLNTLPADGSARCAAIAAVSSSRFGVGNSLHKTGAAGRVPTDTVPYGCFRRRLFDRIGMYDEDMTLNQDDELNGRITRAGGTIYLLPDVVIDYTARGSLRQMANMYWGYGLFKPLVAKKLGRPSTLRQLVPPLFVAWLAAGAALSFAAGWIFYINAATLSLYVTTAAALSVREAARRRMWRLTFIMPWVFPAAHLSYGAGYWAGIFITAAGRVPRFKSKR